MFQAIAKEFNDLIAIGTFTGIEVPHNRKAVSSRIVLKVKHRADGAFDKYKTRLVARGFLHKLGVDFFSTFSPMATLTSIRILLAIAVHNGLDISCTPKFLRRSSKQDLIRTFGSNFLPGLHSRTKMAKYLNVLSSSVVFTVCVTAPATLTRSWCGL